MGKSVWLDDEVLEWVEENSLPNETPNQFFQRLMSEEDVNVWTEDEIKTIAKNAAEEKFFELQRQR